MVVPSVSGLPSESGLLATAETVHVPPLLTAFMTLQFAEVLVRQSSQAIALPSGEALGFRS